MFFFMFSFPDFKFAFVRRHHTVYHTVGSQLVVGSCIVGNCSSQFAAFKPDS